ncbi:uncharacterized protein [Palaemon carinicauda]|uniref:uncharacterized protein n=1 Tax=Palaemon carinicauda TaxID=392227 RepID=UPI0035B664D6
MLRNRLSATMAADVEQTQEAQQESEEVAKKEGEGDEGAAGRRSSSPALMRFRMMAKLTKIMDPEPEAEEPPTEQPTTSKPKPSKSAPGTGGKGLANIKKLRILCRSPKTLRVRDYGKMYDDK